MKKEILVAISVAGVLFGLSVSLAAQEKLSLAQCREMALKYNKDMAAANKQTEAARDRKSTRLNSSHPPESRMPSSA